MRPAFYALGPTGWRACLALLHPPYTLWHLSYVALGAAIVPEFRPSRLAWTLVAFLLATGVGAHALDELQGRPLQTEIPASVLVVSAATSIAGALSIGIVAALQWTPWLLGFVAAGGFIVIAYNLELFSGRFHGAVWFATWWGAFPVLTAAFASAERITGGAALAAGFAFLASLVQHQFSSQVRHLRRRVVSVSGTIELVGGAREPLGKATLLRGPERGLQTLAAALIVLACALVVARVT